MKISKEDVKHVAVLAHLDLDAAAIEQYTEQVGDILDYVDTLDQADTSGVEGTAHAITRTNAFRDDLLQESLPNESALANAPQQEEGAFIVPKIVP